jgi:hypothetical protein
MSLPTPTARPDSPGAGRTSHPSTTPAPPQDDAHPPAQATQGRTRHRGCGRHARRGTKPRCPVKLRPAPKGITQRSTHRHSPCRPTHLALPEPKQNRTIGAPTTATKSPAPRAQSRRFARRHARNRITACYQRWSAATRKYAPLSAAVLLVGSVLGLAPNLRICAAVPLSWQSPAPVLPAGRRSWSGAPRRRSMRPASTWTRSTVRGRGRL